MSLGVRTLYGSSSIATTTMLFCATSSMASIMLYRARLQCRIIMCVKEGLGRAVNS